MKTAKQKLGRVLVEKFNPEVLARLKERLDIAVVDPWVEMEQWEAEAPQVDAIISRKGKITKEHILRSQGKLKIIARTGVGVDVSRVDIDAATQNHVWVTNMPGSNAASVAELAFGHMISLARKIIQANQAVKDSRWCDYLLFKGTELAHKTIGIIGMGHIGTRVAVRAKAFEMNFLVYDPYIPESHVTALGGKFVSLTELLSESDFVTIHCPLNAETRCMIGEKELPLLKTSAFLINAARGGIVDEAALYAILERGGIAGAALDVMGDEPPPQNHPLFSLDNVIFTPHIGALTEEASLRGEWGAAEEVVRVLEGKEPRNPVNRID